MSSFEHNCCNCKYFYEDINGKHCLNCTHNATDHWEGMSNYEWITKLSIYDLEDFMRNTNVSETVGNRSWLRSLYKGEKLSNA